MATQFAGSVLQARAGVARAAVTRSNAVTGLTARITINGTDRSTAILKESIVITQNLNDQVDTCTLRTRGLSFVPAEGQTITISLGDNADNLLFGGRIQAVTVFGGVADQHGTWGFECYCTDYTFQASKRLVLKRYLSSSASVIVADLIATYTSGLTTAHVQSGLASIDDITFTMTPIPEALTRIAERIGAYWYFDYTGDLHFFTTETRPAPETLSVSSSWNWRNFRHRTDISQVRTRVYVEGRGGMMSEFQEPMGASPDISIDTPTEQFLHPPDAGLSTAFVRWKTLIFEYNAAEDSPYNKLQGEYGNIETWTNSEEDRPREGDEVNQWVTRNDTTAQTTLAAIEGGDGIREYYLQDRRLNYDGAAARGDAELDLYASRLITFSYDTQDVNARPGTEVTLSITSPLTISGTFRIQSVQIADLELSDTQFPWRRVTASSVRFDFYDLLRRRRAA